ncbi:uncharacterized protein BDR25DRAFT_350582 [Lindgomyces ingoldianus]|uniref:Uncharacterized protein n=1 Tax=Lindgomyces ingoldianus TaxID=673940 RepID=A0ACB6R793_9PLEO|nr:uncharacterized protein BDR25DRAFT_350582 [Lindgomyces ingoldianus]KAF2475174.1 hypothetical protein BDR25DRAFT_350582 [Lindgomyces ingoldianus]
MIEDLQVNRVQDLGRLVLPVVAHWDWGFFPCVFIRYLPFALIMVSPIMELVIFRVARHINRYNELEFSISQDYLSSRRNMAIPSFTTLAISYVNVGVRLEEAGEGSDSHKRSALEASLSKKSDMFSSQIQLLILAHSAASFNMLDVIYLLDGMNPSVDEYYRIKFSLVFVLHGLNQKQPNSLIQLNGIHLRGD